MNQLLVCISYDIQDGVIEAFFEAIAASECQQIDMRLCSIGADYQTITLILEGSWNQLTRFKTKLSVLKEHYSINSMVYEVSPKPYAKASLPYEVYITMPAHPKALHHAISFFLSLPFSIHKLSTISYKAPVTSTNMLELSLLLITPSSQSVHDYRDNILQFCDDNNFEVLLESKRT